MSAPGSHLEAPDPDRALALYRRHAPGYDASAERTMRLRRRTIAALGLEPGQTVLDVACGTGLSFGLLREGVGESGRIVGVELSPEMLALARARCERERWRNVTLIESAMETAEISGPIDAVLFNFTHDVLRSPRALERIFAIVRPGGRIAVAGMKLAPPWLSWLNPLIRAKARPYMTTFEGLDRPWSLLERYVDRFDWQPVLFGTGYIGRAVVRRDHGAERSAGDRNSGADA